MARLLPSKKADREEATGDEAATRKLNLRTALLGLGALAGGYAVGRRLLRGGTPPADALRKRAGDALPGDGVDVPIVGKGGTDDGGAGDEDSADGGESGEPAPGADPSLEEIDERTGSDVKEEPAEPGEMQVDEDVLEEAVDDEDETEE